MKILLIGYVWPEPTSTGAGKRVVELIQLFLAQQWQVTFACPAAKTEFTLDLEALGVESVEIKVNDSQFDEFIGELQPDVVIFDRFMMEEQFGWRVEKTCPDALRMIETIDFHALREGRHQALKAKRTFAIEDVNNEVAVREVAAMYRSDISLIISDYELALLQDYFHISPDLLHLCPFMYDANAIALASPSFAQREHFMTIGNFRHAPNWDAVLHLKQEIWPLIRQQLPQAEMHIYGAYTPPKATALHSLKDGFLIKDRADHVQQVMQQARLCLAPLRFGAGIKTKLADAMLAGTPNVSTAIAAEGMTGGLAWAGSIADDGQSFAHAAVQLYQDESRWKQAQQHGFAIIRQYFNEKANGEALIQRILSVKKDLQAHRKANFTGAMLRHHHQRSTEFMSRWIELKNK
ncbi:MAG: glycosyltransferase family 4 protein [Ghiorsea sp.]